MKSLLCLALLFPALPAFAQSGADVLLDQLGEKSADPLIEKKGTAAAKGERQFPTGDAFQQQLALRLRDHRKLSFDVKQWANHVLTGEFTSAAHLWTAIQMQIPANFRNEAEATQLYLLWKLGLNQTFFDQWIRNLANAAYAKSAPELTLESLFTPGLDGWLLNNGIILNQKAMTILDRLPDEKLFLVTLKAYSDVRRVHAATEILPSLSPENKLTPVVAQTVFYGHIHKNDLKGAAKVLKEYVEPSIDVSHDLELLALNDLSIARILYQAGQMNAAATFYQKIPNQSTYYLPAREELAWVYLRQGDMSQLRGEVKALSSPLFKDRFQPETYLLRAVSDLKMCFYDGVDKDLHDFTASNVGWAQRIDQALTDKVVPAPTPVDAYTRRSQAAVVAIGKEIDQLKELGHLSIAATLPAVGVQRHWKDYLDLAHASLETAKKHQSDEYSRQWKNQRSALVEAIRKMRFVKVEYMSQVRQLAGRENPAADKTKLVASNSDTVPARSVLGDSDQMNFSANTEIWPDELFKLRSAAQARCLKKTQ